MNILLDTCALIRCVSEPGRLSSAAREARLADDASVAVSAISCAEIACLAETDRIRVRPHWRTWFNRAVAGNGWSVFGVDLEIVMDLGRKKTETRNTRA